MIEQLNKSEQYFKGLSDQELSSLVKELEKVSHEDSSPIRKAINELYGDNVGVYILRVSEFVYPLLKEVHSRWCSK